MPSAPDSPAESPSWIGRLTRVTTSGRFIPLIDGFRFLAIALVFLTHDLGHTMAKNGIGLDANRTPRSDLLQGPDRWLHLIVSTGFIGVQLFFVISGFILALPFAEHYLKGDKKPRLGAYFLRRTTRLEPPFLLNVLICAAVLGLVYHWSPRFNVEHSAATAVYLHTQIFGAASPINVVTWTLEIEVQFYILAPLLACVFMIRPTWPRRAVLASLILGSALFNHFLGPADFRYIGSIANAIQYFLAGFMLADLFLIDASWLTGKRSLAWDAIALLTTVALFGSLIHGDELVARLPHLPWCILLLYIAGFKSVLFHAFLRWPPVFIIGGMCYTIYLYHFIVLSVTAQLTRRLYMHGLPLWTNFVVQCFLHAVIVLVISVVLFVLVERPCMRRDWPQRLWAMLTGKPRPSTA